MLNNNDIKFSDNDISIRKINETDKETCIRIWQSGTVVKYISEKDKFNQAMWEEYTKPSTLAFLIFNDSNNVCGICQLDHTDTPTPHIGIDILEKYRQKGYGYKSVRLLLENAYQICNAKYFIWRCFIDNIASQKLVEKLNGILVEKKPSLPQSIIEMGKESGIYKTEDDIPTIYEYRINVDSL